MMIVSVLNLDLKPGAIEALEEVFRRHRILETAIEVDGCWKLSLSHPEGTDRACVIGFWADRAAYQRWLDHPARGASSSDLMEIMAGDFDPKAAAELHDVLHCIPDRTAWAD